MKYKKSHMFVSPHFDDAVFSAGGYMENLVKKKEKVVVVNIFTKASEKPYTFSAKRYLQACRYLSAKKLYNAREKEDKLALDKLGASIINLSYVDALWRKRKNPIVHGIAELENIYPTYRLHIQRGKIHEQDVQLMESLTSELRKIAAKNLINHVYAPIGIGSHIDHLIVKDAVKTMNIKKTYYWEDYPYNVNISNEEEVVIKHKPDWNKKLELMKLYKTQFDIIFSSGVIEKEERFIQ